MLSMSPAISLPAPFSVQKIKPACACLPQGVSAGDVVSTEVAETRGNRSVKKVTVRAKLKELKARCRKGKLVDAKGKEIRFFRMQGCWGNPPDDYQEILARQAKELEKLRKRYRVIAMTCDESGELISGSVDPTRLRGEGTNHNCLN